jgi:hypothetical protein
MSYKVTDSEKYKAEQALIYFEEAAKLLVKASDYLNIMKTPFKDNADMTPQDIVKARAVVRRFRDKAIDNFNSFKQMAFKCVDIMQIFSTDTQTLKLIKAFITSIDELEAIVNRFANLFSDLESKNFSTDVVTNIESIQEKCDDIDDIIDERIKSHIQTNILATSWVDSISNDLQMKIEKKTPLVLDLFNARQKQLNDVIEDRTPAGN